MLIVRPHLTDCMAADQIRAKQAALDAAAAAAWRAQQMSSVEQGGHHDDTSLLAGLEEVAGGHAAEL
jgi:hypothetical protein